MIAACVWSAGHRYRRELQQRNMIQHNLIQRNVMQRSSVQPNINGEGVA